MGFILKVLVTRMKMDYQDDSSFSSWYPIKPALNEYAHMEIVVTLFYLFLNTSSLNNYGLLLILQVLIGIGV